MGQHKTMKTFLTILFFLTCLGSFGQSVKEIKLVKAVKEFHQALLKKNIISINQQKDKALSYGHSNGWVQNKTELLKDLETGLISYQVFEEDSITVTSNAILANVRFVANVVVMMKGVSSTYSLKVLEVWQKK